jgi:hypothetical protein
LVFLAQGDVDSGQINQKDAFFRSPHLRQEWQRLVSASQAVYPATTRCKPQNAKLKNANAPSERQF